MDTIKTVLFLLPERLKEGLTEERLRNAEEVRLRIGYIIGTLRQ